MAKNAKNDQKALMIAKKVLKRPKSAPKRAESAVMSRKIAPKNSSRKILA